MRRLVSDQCQFGQETAEGDPIRKRIGWLSNAPMILKALDRRCYGKDGRCTRLGGGRHKVCSGEVARRAAVYPFELCRTILTGIRDQLRQDERHFVGICGIMPRPDAQMTMKQLERRIERVHRLSLDETSSVPMPASPRNVSTAAAGEECDLLDSEGMAVWSVVTARTAQYKDALTGQALDPEMVQAARRTELEYFNSKGVWTLRPWAEARARQGKPPVSVKWVDIN